MKKLFCIFINMIPVVVTLCLLLFLVSASLMSSQEVLSSYGPAYNLAPGMVDFHLLPREFTIEQYKTILWENPEFLTHFWNSMAITIPIAILVGMVGTLAGYGFARFQFPFKGYLFCLLFY